MPDPDGGNDRYLAPGSAGRKSAPNVSGGWIVMLLSGLIAFVVFLFVTEQGDNRFTVAVASGPIAPGDRISASSFRDAHVNVPKAQLDRLVQRNEVSNFEGWIATAPLEPGDLVVKSTLRESGGEAGTLRVMSIPVARERAVEGAIRPGDRIDVISRAGNRSYVVAYNLEVLHVTSGSGNAIGGGTNFSVTVGLSADEAVAVNFAVNESRHDVVRSTGADPIQNPAGTANTGEPAGTRSATPSGNAAP